MKIERPEVRSKAISHFSGLIANGNLYSDCLAPLLTSQSWWNRPTLLRIARTEDSSKGLGDLLRLEMQKALLSSVSTARWVNDGKFWFSKSISSPTHSNTRTAHTFSAGPDWVGPVLFAAQPAWWSHFRNFAYQLQLRQSFPLNWQYHLQS